MDFTNFTIRGVRATRALKSGPVRFFGRTKTRPVLEVSKTQKNRTGTGKNRRKPVQTGLDRSWNKCIKMWFKPATSATISRYFVKVNCGLPFDIYFKLLIIQIGGVGQDVRVQVLSG